MSATVIPLRAGKAITDSGDKAEKNARQLLSELLDGSRMGGVAYLTVSMTYPDGRCASLTASAKGVTRELW